MTKSVKSFRSNVHFVNNFFCVHVFAFIDMIDGNSVKHKLLALLTIWHLH